MKKILSVAVVLAVALVMFAPTSEATFYLGASATQTKVSLDDSGFNEDDIGWKGFVGYNFIRYFGLELSYYDMGKLSDSAESIELSAAALSARGILPLGKHFELFAKVGYMAWDAKRSAVGDLDDFDLTYGAGAAVIIGSHFEIKAEYEILDVDGADVDLISLGVAWRF
jgi:OOP family OmpA-OmpF porin